MLALLLTLTCQPAPAVPDIIFPGSHGVTHDFVIEGIDRAPAGTRFFLFPVRGDGFVQEVVDGEPFRFYKLFKPRVYATRGELPSYENRGVTPELPASTIALQMVSSVKDADPLDSLRTVYEFQGIENDVVKLELVEELRYGKDGELLDPPSAGEASTDPSSADQEAPGEEAVPSAPGGPSLSFAGMGVLLVAGLVGVGVLLLGVIFLRRRSSAS